MLNTCPNCGNPVCSDCGTHVNSGAVGAPTFQRAVQFAPVQQMAFQARPRLTLGPWYSLIYHPNGQPFMSHLDFWRSMIFLALQGKAPDVAQLMAYGIPQIEPQLSSSIGAFLLGWPTAEAFFNWMLEDMGISANAELITPSSKVAAHAANLFVGTQ